MRTLILTALLFATTTPLLAQVPPPDVRVDQSDRRDGDRRDGDRRDQPGDRRDDRGPGDRSDDRRDYRQDGRQDDRRDYRQDGRQDDRRDYRQDGRQDERRDFRQDERRDFRQDERRDFRDDRRSYGDNDRYARFHADRYYFPRGYSYRAYGIGAILPRVFWDQRYYIAQPDYYRLPPAFRGTHWVRFGPDALLVRNYDGRIVRVIRGLFY